MHKDGGGVRVPSHRGAPPGGQRHFTKDRHVTCVPQAYAVTACPTPSHTYIQTNTSNVPRAITGNMQQTTCNNAETIDATAPPSTNREAPWQLQHHTNYRDLARPATISHVCSHIQDYCIYINTPLHTTHKLTNQHNLTPYRKPYNLNHTINNTPCKKLLKPEHRIA